MIGEIGNPFLKDPQAKLDYGFDWTDWLAPIHDTISVSTWAVDNPDLAIVTSGIAAGSRRTTVWLASGTVDSIYAVKNHVTTLGGREDDRTFYLQVVQR